MNQHTLGANRRTHQRYAVDKSVDVQIGDQSKPARLKDISGGGAAVSSDIDYDLEAGQHIDLDVEDMGYYGAEVIRELEEGYAVRFDMDDDERGELIAEIREHGIAVAD